MQVGPRSVLIPSELRTWVGRILCKQATTSTSVGMRSAYSHLNIKRQANQHRRSTWRGCAWGAAQAPSRQVRSEAPSHREALLFVTLKMSALSQRMLKRTLQSRYSTDAKFDSNQAYVYSVRKLSGGLRCEIANCSPHIHVALNIVAGQALMTE